MTNSMQTNKNPDFSSCFSKNPLWCIESICFNENTLEIRGWALPSYRFPCVTFTTNNENFDNIEFPISRYDIAKVFWYIPYSYKSGFRCMKELKRSLFEEMHLVLKYVNSKTLLPFKEKHNYYFKIIEQIHLPPAMNRSRVHGTDREDSFRLEGFTTFVKLRIALKKLLYKDYCSFTKILDWGCGCGRMTRYFSSIKDVNIIGCDIDQNNIEWCRKNLKFGEFKVVSLHPPTKFEDCSFDLIIGISVFSHMRMREQFEWLKELQRIIKDGGILLMSVHGDTSIFRTGNLELFDKRKISGGFYDYGSDASLENVIEDKEYYRTSFHSVDYVKLIWGKYFKIVDVIPGYIGNNQDLIIMKKI